MKEAQRWQSRVELSLDNRQIFLLFFASAVVVSLVFALGVVVGKRFDCQPARAATTDPLALLDQMGQESGEDSLTFHEALSNDKPAPAAQARLDGGAAPAATPKPDPATPPVAPRPAAKPEAKPSAVKALADKLLSRAPPAAIAAAPTESGKKELGKPKKEPAKDKGAVEGSEGKTDDEGTYTLQLSSFQEKREAELFMQKLRDSGLSPYLTPTTIPGRGVWYRVRHGKYKSWDEALTAKQTFEKKQKIIAYVSKT